MTTMLVMIGSYRAWSAERDRADGVPGAGGKPQQYGRDAGAHNARDGYMSQPRQWDNRGQYRPFVPGGMGCVSCSYLYHSCPILVFLYLSSTVAILSVLHAVQSVSAVVISSYCFDCHFSVSLFLY